MNKNNLLILLFLAFGMLLFSTNIFAVGSVTFNNPQNNSYYNQNITFNLTVSDNGFYNVTFNYTNSTNNTIINETYNSTSPFIFIWNSTEVAGGIYNFTVFIINYTNLSDNVTVMNSNITIDNTMPNINLYLPTNNSTSENLTQIFNYTPSDNAGFNNCSLWTNSTASWNLDVIDQTIENDANNTIQKTFLSDGIFIWNVQCFDLAGNSNFAIQNFTLNLNASPQWYNQTPPNGSTIYYSSGAIYQFNITWLDSSLSEVILTFNGTDYTKSSGNLNKSGNVYNKTFTDLPAGTYSYKWFANDTDGKQNNTTILSYTISNASTPIGLTSSDVDWTILTSEAVTITCSESAPIPIDVKLTVQDFNPELNTTSKSLLLQNLLAKSYTITCEALGNANYSYNVTSGTLIVQNPATTTTTTTTTTTVTGSFTITNLTSSLSVNAGENKSTSFTLKNTLDAGTLTNVTISLTGIDSSWYSTSPSKISNLYRNIPQTVTITFNIPENAEVKSYSITVKAEGKPLLSTITKTAQQSMTLVVNPKIVQNITTANITTGTTANITNVTGNVTAGPTGFILNPIDFAYVIAVVGIISSILVFVARHKITTALMKMHKGRTFKSSKPKKRFSFLRDKLLVKLKKPKA